MELLYAFGAAYAASILCFMIMVWRAPLFDDDERPIPSAEANASYQNIAAHSVTSL